MRALRARAPILKSLAARMALEQAPVISDGISYKALAAPHPHQRALPYGTHTPWYSFMFIVQRGCDQ